jgi:hypothetical protein
MENPRSKALQAQLGELEDQRDEIEAALGNTSNRPPLSNCTPMWVTFTAGKFAT